LVTTSGAISFDRRSSSMERQYFACPIEPLD
jgi:hypothetical protein